MSTVDVLRPVSTRFDGAGTAVPGGTLHGVTSDDDDGTYIDFDVVDYGDNWSLRLEPHTPAAGYGRHQIRGRIRAQCDAGTCSEDIDLGRGISDYVEYQGVNLDDSFDEYATPWYQNSDFGLDVSGALSDLNIGGGWPKYEDGATEVYTSECYVDIDCRQQPTYTAEVRDAAGVDRSGGTITDTNKPVLFFGGVAYDGLPPFDWAVEISQSGSTVYAESGSGEPPEKVILESGLYNGTYTIAFSVQSTIRGVDQFESEQVTTVTINNTTPPPSPPLVTVTEQFGGYLVEWSDPGGQPWDDGSVVAEVWREDCTGNRRIATIPDGLNGSYLDLAIPQLDQQPSQVAGVCETVSDACDITYRIRYWGYVSELVELPSNLPDDLILAWPGSEASIPAGWSRVAALDSYYLRGSSDVIAAPVATGGSDTHTHTTPGHMHVIGDHYHTLGGYTGSSSSGTISARFNGASEPQANQPHYHSLPAITWGHYAQHSGITSPGTSSADNLPPTRDVIWIENDGARTEYPIGALGWSTEDVSGWVDDADSYSRFLRGADVGDPGGVNSGASTHTHTVDSHIHTGFDHTHTVDNTGLSLPAGVNAGYGVSYPKWLARHTHPLTAGSGWTGNLVAAGGGTTGSANHEPPNRRLRVLRNTGGGIQTRIIGVYLGDAASLDPLLTLCDGSDGTPDMRDLFCRDNGSSSVNSTGGTSTHSHDTGTHTHDIPDHYHTITVGVSGSVSFTAPSWGDLGYSPTTGHTHSAGNTATTKPSISSDGSGDTDTVSHIPPYHEVHFVRLDGSISITPLAVPELRVSEFAEVTVQSFTYGDGLDRLTDGSRIMALATNREYVFPRLVVDSVPISGGLHTVATTPSGEDVALSIGVEGVPAIDDLEDLLSAGLVYFSPVGGTPGWYAPSDWSVNAPAPGVKVLQAQLVRQDWPTVADPSEYL